MYLLNHCCLLLMSSATSQLDTQQNEKVYNQKMLSKLLENLAIRSAEDLPPQCRANPNGNAQTPPGSLRIRRTSAKIIFRRTPPNIRRTFGGLRRTPRGVRRNWRKSSLEKFPPTKTYLSPLLLAEELPHRTTLCCGNTHRVRVRVRVGVKV